MTKIDIFSGFLGAGKTTLIKKLIKEAYKGESLVLIENEFGEIGIDGGFMADAGIKINELNSGCICCSLVGDFAKALNKVYNEYHPDRILIEPSGVGKLSDVIRAVENAHLTDCKVNTFTAVVDANKCRMYMKNFGEFFNDQIETAACIVFSHADVASPEKLAQAVELVKAHNGKATIVTTQWKDLDGKDILAAMEHADTLESELEKLKASAAEHHHDDDDDDDDDECCCHDHDEDEEHEHHHHHHDEDEEEEEHHHHHHDDDDDDDECCHHDHDHDHEEGHEHHHHHHHADEVFTSWGVETSRAFTKDDLETALKSLTDAVRFGTILRAKGIVPSTDGTWFHFDYIPGETDIRTGTAAYTGRLCVIGSKIDEEELKELFGV
ncbi:MAG: GTP-binding protein [Clostridia bacterium]|nr:GTP-binding protein [Clostridia bacterium]